MRRGAWQAFAGAISAATLLVCLAGCALWQGNQSGTASIEGRVRLETVGTMEGIDVRVTYYDSALGTTVMVGTTKTDSSGRFDMRGLTIAPEVTRYTVTAFLSRYSTANDYYEVFYGYDGKPFSFDFLLKFEKLMIIDWVYQPGSTASFGTGTTAGTAAVYSEVLGGAGPTGLNINTGATTNSWYDADVLFRDSYSTPISLRAGYYAAIKDMGPVALEEVLEAPTSGYTTYSGGLSAVAGNTYCVRTGEKHYAKFTIREIRPSGR